MTSLKRNGLLLILLTLISLPSNAQTEEEAVLAVAQQIFDGINTRNGDLIRSAMLPDALTVSTLNRDGVPMTRSSNATQMAEDVASATQDFHERMFETTVHVQEGVALVWAAYDFHVNGEFSHCGIDTFSFVKTAEGWKAASLTYTVERTGCAERPPIPQNE